MIVTSITTLVQIYKRIFQYKNCENRLILDKVMTMSLVCSVLANPVVCYAVLRLLLLTVVEGAYYKFTIDHSVECFSYVIPMNQTMLVPALLNGHNDSRTSIKCADWWVTVSCWSCQYLSISFSMCAFFRYIIIFIRPTLLPIMLIIWLLLCHWIPVCQVTLPLYR